LGFPLAIAGLFFGLPFLVNLGIIFYSLAVAFYVITLLFTEANMDIGKVPNSVLTELIINKIKANRKEILIRPKVGRIAAP